MSRDTYEKIISDMRERAADLSKQGKLASANAMDDWADRIAALTASPQAAPEDDEYEVRADGQRVRKDRWEAGFRSIVTYIVGPRTEFEIPDIVERVRQLASPRVQGGEGFTAEQIEDMAARAGLVWRNGARRVSCNADHERLAAFARIIVAALASGPSGVES